MSINFTLFNTNKTLIRLKKPLDGFHSMLQADKQTERQIKRQTAKFFLYCRTDPRRQPREYYSEKADQILFEVNDDDDQVFLFYHEDMFDYSV